jgi:hypothetical protein
MAKKRRRARGGESISGYFRTVFRERPDWLHSKSNDALRARWLADHPGETEVPKRVLQNLANVKSLLRKKGRKRKAAKAGLRRGEGLPRPVSRGLEGLEEYIDECLTMARNLDREGLDDVIRMLRRARNDVVWKMGQSS